MKHFRVRMTAIIAMAFMVTVVGSGVGAQHDHHHPSPEASPMAAEEVGTSTGAAYLTISNTGDEPDRLLSIATDAAADVEMHEVTMKDNVMQMNPLHDGLEIPASDEVSMEPRGTHIMLVGLTESLIAGEEYELTLIFEKAGEVTVTVPILRTEPKDNHGVGGPVESGDLVIQNIWSRQAPKLDGVVGAPTASPQATPAP